MNMQHSVRTMSLLPQVAAPGAGVPRQDRSAPPRRSSRHTAAEGPVEDGAGAHGRRARCETPDSFFSVEEPPPIEAPPGIAEITGWELAATMWREHLPEQLLGVDCSACGQAWPCDAWEIADDIIGQCCESARQAAHQADRQAERG